VSMRLEEFKERNRAKGFHWFEPDTIRFFNSVITNFDIITGYFISSERQHDTDERRYTLRRADFASGNVLTISRFQQYSNMRQAKAALKRALRGNFYAQ